MTPANWTDLVCCALVAITAGIALCLAGRRRRSCPPDCPDCKPTDIPA